MDRRREGKNGRMVEWIYRRKIGRKDGGRMVGWINVLEIGRKDG